jgi:MFS family permease
MTQVKPKVGAVAGATTALVLLTAMNFVNYLDRYILPAVQEQIRGEFHLSDSQIGSLTLWFMVAYIACSPVTGWLGDRFPRKPMIVIAALAIAAMNFLTAHVSSYDSLNFRHAALGVGEASFGIFAPALLADYFDEAQRNKVLTIFNMAMPFGAATAYEAGAWVGAHYGWRMSCVTSAVPGMLVGLLIWAILGYAAVTFSLGGISWWMPSFLHRIAGYSEVAAGGVMGPIIVIAGLGGTAFGGWVAQRWSKKTSKALYFLPGIGAALTVPAALVCFFGPKTMLVPSLSAAVFLIFLGTGPVNAATLNAVPANLRATAMAGQLLTIHVLGDMFSPKLIGIVSDHSNLRYGLGVTLVTMLIGSAIFFAGARYAPVLSNQLEAAQAA